MASAASTTGAYDPSATATLFPTARSESLLETLKSTLLPLLLPLSLVSFSLLVGAIQVADKALRRVRKTNRIRRRKLLAALHIDERAEGTRRRVLGFFHPYCNAGGGGERVLYEAIALHLSTDPTCVAVVYTGDYPGASKADILAKAARRFDIQIDADRVALVPLARRWMVEDSAWKSWTLLGQSYGSVWLGFEALAQLIPDVWIDTMGYAFTYPVVRLLDRSIPIAAYVHYPTISTDMLRRVQSRQQGHTNDAATANSKLRSNVKLAYYRLFAKCYAWALARADTVVGNGSWTAAHLSQLLHRKPHDKVKVVYPPCDTAQLAGFALEGRTRTIVSLAQFRPEKEHPTQLYILKQLRDAHPQLFEPSNEGGPVKLVMMGSSRNAEDEKRITMLRALAAQLGLEAQVEFVVNADFGAVLERLRTASIGISTMRDEHFGINVVEFMAAGLITVSHKSAGPWLDIAVPSANCPLPANADKSTTESAEPKAQPTGYHADTVEQFASVLATIFDQQVKQPDEVLAMRTAARDRAQRVFGREAFVQSWNAELWSKLEARLDAVQPQAAKKKEQ